MRNIKVGVASMEKESLEPHAANFEAAASFEAVGSLF